MNRVRIAQLRHDFGIKLWDVPAAFVADAEAPGQPSRFQGTGTPTGRTGPEPSRDGLGVALWSRGGPGADGRYHERNRERHQGEGGGQLKGA